MSEQATTGPRRMRQWADYIEKNIKHHLLPLAVKNPDVLRELAAQWEADRAALDSETNRADAAELRAERAEAANAEERGEWSKLYSLLTGDHGAWSFDDFARAIKSQQAALEQALVLLAELEWCGADYCLECPWCLGPKTEHHGEPAGHKPECRLAALLAAAPGGDSKNG